MISRRPILRYPGGKFKIADWVISHFPAHNTYCELFGGAASVLMRKPRSKGEIYNDLDGDVVNVFRVLRDPESAARLTELLYLTPFSYSEYKQSYEPCEDPIERARRVIYRSFAGIGSDSVRRQAGFRGTKNGYGMVAGPEWAKYPAYIQAFVDRLRGVVIEERDAVRLIDIYDGENTLFYADPPYVRSTRSSYSVHYHNEMKDVDHEALAKMWGGVKGKVIVSGYMSQLYERIYEGWTRVERSAIDQSGNKRVECLWMSPNINTRLF